MIDKTITVTSFNPPAIMNIKDKSFVVDNSKWIEVPKNIKIVWKPLDISGLPLYVNPNFNTVKPKRIFKILSSKKDKFYNVTYDGSKWKCECVRNSAFRKTCRHIKEAKGKIN